MKKSGRSRKLKHIIIHNNFLYEVLQFGKIHLNPYSNHHHHHRQFSGFVAIVVVFVASDFIILILVRWEGARACVFVRSTWRAMWLPIPLKIISKTKNTRKTERNEFLASDAMHEKQCGCGVVAEWRAEKWRFHEDSIWWRSRRATHIRTQNTEKRNKHLRKVFCFLPFSFSSSAAAFNATTAAAAVAAFRLDFFFSLKKENLDISGSFARANGIQSLVRSCVSLRLSFFFPSSVFLLLSTSSWCCRC